jgi:hypothetical protein
MRVATDAKLTRQVAAKILSRSLTMTTTGVSSAM